MTALDDALASINAELIECEAEAERLAAELEQLAAGLRPVSYRRGDQVALGGALPDGLLLIEDGLCFATAAAPPAARSGGTRPSAAGRLVIMTAKLVGGDRGRGVGGGWLQDTERISFQFLV